MHGQRLRRIADPVSVKRANPDPVEQGILELLHRIHGFYEAALDRLPLEEIPSLAPRLLAAGVCFGVLDPVSNIIANTVAYSPPTQDHDDNEAQRLHDTREEIFAKIVTDTDDDDVFTLPLDPSKAGGMTVARRSLDGLVNFLIYNFRYLAASEALRYLRQAGGDMLTAVRLVELDRYERWRSNLNQFSFSIASLNTKEALILAAVTAKHPAPSTFVRSSLSLASRLAEASKLMSPEDSSSPGRLSIASVSRLTWLIKRKPNGARLKILQQPLRLAGSRYHDGKNKRKRGDELTAARAKANVTFRYTQTLKLLLLDKIHVHYLEALARLPADALREGYSFSLLKAGYCYGPLDPVSNIILNTIWFDTKFPTHQDFEVEMMCTKALARIECASLYGLVAFIRTLFSSLTEHDALSYLLANNADISLTITMAERFGHLMSGTDLYAYKSAALDSWHPHRHTFVKFVKSLMPMEFAKLSLLLNDRMLSRCGVEHLSMSLSPKSSPTKPDEHALQLNSAVSILSENQIRFISVIQKKFQADQRFIVRKVNAALNSYSEKNGGHYELHVICGVNPFVPVDSLDSEFNEKVHNLEHYIFKRKMVRYYSHINFWATPKGPNSPGTAPVLFFAECSNVDEDEEEGISLCFPVFPSSIDAVRCFHCELNGIKIVHPCDESYYGRCEEFHDMAHGKRGFSNETLINACNCYVDVMCTLIEDWIYFDPKTDAKIAEMSPKDDWDMAMSNLRDRIY